MRRASFSFLELFQDPVFTILALILLATTPMIFPGEGKKIDPQVPVLMEEINALERTINDLKGQQALLEQEKGEKDSEYQGLAQDLKGFEQKKHDSKEKEQDQINTLKRLKNDLHAKRQEVEKTKNDLARLNTRPGHIPEGFYAMGDSSKQDFYIQLVGNRLFPLDNQHFSDRDAHATIAGGEIVAVTVKKRKAGAAGDRLEDLGKPDSKLEKVLKDMDSRQKRIMFLVHQDSFPIFRKAREQVFHRKFECGWVFTNRQEIILGAVSRDERLPSAAPQ